MYYGNKREAKVNLAVALMSRGWKIYGFKEDESDSMTDYYSPRSWDGIATKNGLTLVVDNYNTKDTEAKEIYKTEYKANNSEIHDKIEKVQQLAERGATEGEKASARNMLLKLNERLEKEEQKAEASKVLEYTIPAYSAHPTKRTLWHAEKDGVILAKGASLFTLYNLPDYYDVTTLTVNKSYHEKYRRFDYNGNDTWTPEKLIEFYTQSDEEERAIKLLNKIINEVEKHAKEFETVSLGDGTKETEEKGKTRGYKRVVKTKIKRKLQMVEVNREVKEGDYITLPHHGHYWLVTADYTRKGTWKGVTEEKRALTYECVGAESRGYKRNKNTKRYYDFYFRMEGKIKVFELKEIDVTEEYDALVKDDYQEPKQAKKSSNNSEKSPTVDENKTDDTEVKAEIKIVYNEDMNGIEVEFLNGKPSEQIRNILKANKFRWHGRRRLWYAKQTDERKALVEQMAI